MSAIEVESIRGEIDAVEAERLANASSPTFVSGKTRPIFYPYYWLSFRETVETFVGASSIRISCLVDGRRGLTATSDAFEIELRGAGARDVLPCAIAEEEAMERGRRFVRHAPRARLRALVASRREELGRGLVYKPFWVVSGVSERVPSSVLVDGVTGDCCRMSRE
jgi:hypothetical protein